jgi:hypothetical protein
MCDRNIYNESRKIPAARKQFRVRRNISVNCAAAHPRSLEGTLGIIHLRWRPQFITVCTRAHRYNRNYIALSVNIVLFLLQVSIHVTEPFVCKDPVGVTFRLNCKCAQSTHANENITGICYKLSWCRKNTCVTAGTFSTITVLWGAGSCVSVAANILSHLLLVTSHQSLRLRYLLG